MDAPFTSSSIKALICAWYGAIIVISINFTYHELLPLNLKDISLSNTLSSIDIKYAGMLLIG